MKFLYKFNIFIILFTLLILPVYSKEIKFIQITDSHVSGFGENYAQREIETSQKVLTNTIKDINSISNVDFVVFTGDNIDQANENDLKSFLKIANHLNVPYYVVIGNHEVFQSQKFGKKEYMKTVSKYSKNCRAKNANYVFKNKGLIFIVLDGAKEVIPGPAGYYKKDTLAWFDKKLQKYKDKKVVVLQHFPVVAPYYNRTHTTYKPENYEAVLKKHSNVIAIFSGHYHANAEVEKDGVYHVSTPALVENPHNYKIVEISLNNKKDYQIYTQLRHAE
jgi:predicted MPP superfamily phosphohydrolase